MKNICTNMYNYIYIYIYIYQTGRRETSNYTETRKYIQYSTAPIPTYTQPYRFNPLSISKYNLAY